MNKFISLSLSAALLAMPMAGCAEGALDTAMNAVTAADSVEAQFTLSSTPEALAAMGLTDDNAQMVSGMLDTYALDMVIGNNMFHASLDTEDSSLIDAAAEIDGDTVYLSTSLLDKVYCISVDELIKLANSSASVTAQTDSLSLSQETINEISQKLGALNYNFDSTIAYVSTLAGKIETATVDPITMTSLELSADEVVTLLRTAAADFAATEGAADVLAAYVPGITAENLGSELDALIDQFASAFSGWSLAASSTTVADSLPSYVLSVSDGSTIWGAQLSFEESSADLTVFQTVGDDSTDLCSLTVAWEATDDTAKTDIALTVGEEQIVLSLGAAGEDNMLGLSAGVTMNSTQLGTAVLAVAPNDEAVESWITDKTGAVDITTLSADDQEAIYTEMGQNLENALSEDTDEELHTRVRKRIK